MPSRWSPAGPFLHETSLHPALAVARRPGRGRRRWAWAADGGRFPRPARHADDGGGAPHRSRPPLAARSRACRSGRGLALRPVSTPDGAAGPRWPGRTLWAASLGLMNVQFVDLAAAAGVPGHLPRPARGPAAAHGRGGDPVRGRHRADARPLRGDALPRHRAAVPAARGAAAAGLVGSAMLFALIHVDAVGDTAPPSTGCPFAFAVGLGLAALRSCTGSLIPPIAGPRRPQHDHLRDRLPERRRLGGGGGAAGPSLAPLLLARRRRRQRGDLPRPPSLTVPRAAPTLACMRITSRLAAAAAVLAFAVPMFRPVAGAGGLPHRFRAAPERDSPRAQLRESQVIVPVPRRHRRCATSARVSREAGAARVRRSSFATNRYLMTLDAGFTPQDAMERLASAPEVEYVEPQRRRRTPSSGPTTPTSPCSGTSGCSTPSAPGTSRRATPRWSWPCSTPASPTRTSVPTARLPTSAARPSSPASTSSTATRHANDDNFHGTHVASTIAEATDNSEGVTGFAFRCALMPVKVLDENGDGSFFDVAEGIDFAVRNAGVKVINLSLGGEGNSADRPDGDRPRASPPASPWWPPPATTAAARSASRPPCPT